MSKTVLLQGGPTPGSHDVDDNHVGVREEFEFGWYRKTGRKVTLEVWEYEAPDTAALHEALPA